MVSTKMTVLVAFSAAGAFAAAMPSKLPSTNHWLANTFGGMSSVQNFIEDMVVYYSPDPQFVKPMVLTKSFWDEGGCGICSYHDGLQIGKRDWWKDLIDSRTTSRLGTTCKIGNFYGRAFLYKIDAPPKGAAAPYVACNGFDTIRNVEDPTAVAFDLKGNLMVADNGKDQNIKIFGMTTKTPTLMRTFGDSGGVFAGTKPGSAGIRRFWGLRGIGIDSSENIYVGTTGMPMQVGGGTDIRVFATRDSLKRPLKDTTLLWQVQGLAFVNTADADPDSNGTSVYKNSMRFHMDLSQAPGKSWKLAAATVSPFQYPDDPRLSNSLESVFVRRINGVLYLYLTDMALMKLAVIRFDPKSEIGIPTAFFCLMAKGQDSSFWAAGKHPVWDPNVESNKNRRWMWRDRNGDGKVDTGEFSEFNLSTMYNGALDIDEHGDIWFGGRGVYDARFKEGGILHIPFGGADANKVPLFPTARFKYEPSPFSDYDGYDFRLKYLADKDVMYLTSGPAIPYSAVMWRIDNWSDTAKRVVTQWKLPYEDFGAKQISLDQNTGNMILPISFTADSEYVYLTYLDKGPDAKVRGEITVLDGKTGSKVGWIVPTAAVDSFSGAIDLPNAINVKVLSDKTRMLYVEEDGKGKIMAHRWMKQPTAEIAQKSGTTGPASASWSPNGLRINGGEWNRVRVLDLTGRSLGEWATTASRTSMTISYDQIGRIRGPVICQFLSGQTQSASVLVPPPMYR